MRLSFLTNIISNFYLPILFFHFLLLRCTEACYVWWVLTNAYPCNPHFYQSIEYFYYPRRFPRDPSQSTLSPRLLCQAQPLSPYTSPACASLSCEGSKTCVLFCLALFTQLEIQPCCSCWYTLPFLLPSGIPLMSGARFIHSPVPWHLGCF